MKLLKLVLSFSFLLLSTTFVYSQFLNRLSFEIGFNRSTNLHTGSLTLHEIDGYNLSTLTNSDDPSFENNLSVSVGFKLSRNHQIRIRHSYLPKNIYLDNYYSIRRFECGISHYYTSFHKKIEQSTIKILGGLYEVNIPLERGKLFIGAGFEKLWIEISDLIRKNDDAVFYDIRARATFGYQMPMTGMLHFFTKAFASRSVSSFDVEDYYTGKLQNSVPFQVGLELGFRLELDSI